jgi:putative peptidoglycan lipid II flippase
MSLSGVVVGILASHDHFSAPALAPIAWNGAIVAALLAITPFTSRHDDIYVYAVATLVGTVLQAVIPLPWLRGRGHRLSWSVTFRDPHLREMLVLMVPVTVSLGLINIQQLIDTKFSVLVPARLIPRGVGLDQGPAILDNAFRIYMLPQGIFSVAISTVVFPALARYASRGDTARFRETFSDGLRQIFLLLLPSSALLIALAEPSVRLLYQHGEFTAAQTPIVADTIRGFAWGLAFNGASLLVIRALFSQRAPRVATVVSVLTLVVNGIADALLYRHLGVPGVALATSVTNVAGFSTLYLLLRRRVGRLDTARNVRAVAAALVASALAAGLAWVAWDAVDGVLGRSLPAQVASVGAATICGGALYLAITVRLGLIRRGVVAGMVRRRR